MERITLAQAVGEQPLAPLPFVPYEDFDPTDPEEREIVAAAMDRHLADDNARLRRENAALTAALTTLEEAL